MANLKSTMHNHRHRYQYQLRNRGLLLSLLCTVLAGPAAAQGPSEPAPQASSAKVVAAPTPEVQDDEAPAASPEVAASSSVESPALSKDGKEAQRDDLSALRAQVEAQAAAITELQQAKENAETAALLGHEDVEPDAETLRLYGFMDMGLQRAWVDKKSIVGSVLATNAASFLIGNINLYIDAQPTPNWRALAEVRFTNAPQGEIDQFGVVLGGTTISEFERNNVEQIDPGGAGLNTPIWPGTTVIERAWVEYNEHQLFKLRVGNFFTPFGIWNVDHGTPTLMSTAMPQFLLLKYIPIRQTGVQLYGNTFSGDWELGYHLTLTNGRQELSNFDFDDDKGVGGRVFAEYQSDDTSAKFGLSGYVGDVEDQALVVTSLAPLEFERDSTFEYDEYMIGADLALDAGSFRLRTEAMVRRLQYQQGKRPSVSQFGVAGVTPDAYQFGGYLIAGYDLGLLGLEPYFHTELLNRPSALIGDAVFLAQPGLNVQLSRATKLKLQYSRAWFFSMKYDLPEGVDPSVNDANIVYARLVVAF